MPERQSVNWQPISALPQVASMIRGGLEEAQNLYETLLEAKEKPHVLDDFTVSRVIDVHKQTLDDLLLYEEQLARWKKLELKDDQRREIEILTDEAARLRETTVSILALAGELKKGTIERVLEKDDFELGLETLLGKWKP